MTDQRSAADLLLRCLTGGRVPIEDCDEPASVWRDVARVAAGHDLAPLLHARLKRARAMAFLPADVRAQLRDAYFSNANRNLRLYKELGSALKSLREAAMPVMVLKGAYLAENVYRDVAVRPMGDVDLMVRREDLPGAQTILFNLGGAAEHVTDIEWCCRTGSHLPAIIIRGLALEIHWNIAAPNGPIRLEVAGLWQRSRRSRVAGVEVLSLSPEDLLLHLCLSATVRDGLMGGLRSFVDIRETVQGCGQDLDWAATTARAHEWGGARYVYLALRLAREMLDAEVPAVVLDQLVPGGTDEGVLETARRSVLTRSGYDNMMPLSYEHLGAKTAGGKAKLIWQRVFLSREEMAVTYPASRNARVFGLYYIARLRDVTRTYGRHVLARTRRSMSSPGSTGQALLANWLRAGKS